MLPPALMPSSALLLLTDGRFPAGAHSHSGGLEAAAALEGVHDVTDLEEFLRGRATTAAAVASAFAAAACAAVRSDENLRVDSTMTAVMVELDDEFQARTPSPALRAASRRLGRQLLRTARHVWQHPALDQVSVIRPEGLHQPPALGVVAAVAGLDPHAAALAAAHEAVVGPAIAAVRLLGLDPFAVHAALARLGSHLDAVAAAGAAHARTPPDELPAWATPLLDICAEHHATWEVRLFAS